MFNRTPKTTATILSTFTKTIADLQAVQATHLVLADKKAEAAHTALAAANAARAEAATAGAAAAKFQSLVDAS
jgi:hypothetical protein